MNKNANAMQFSVLEMKDIYCNIFFQKVKGNESTREENNAYFDISPKTMPKSYEPQYCNKNVATLKATNFNYQPKVCKNLRGMDTIFVAYNASFLYCHDVMKCM